MGLSRWSLRDTIYLLLDLRDCYEGRSGTSALHGWPSDDVERQSWAAAPLLLDGSWAMQGTYSPIQLVCEKSGGRSVNSRSLRGDDPVVSSRR
jgi:hypothetical protein